jgi:hypothetical protein
VVSPEGDLVWSEVRPRRLARVAVERIAELVAAAPEQ